MYIILQSVSSQEETKIISMNPMRTKTTLYDMQKLTVSITSFILHW